MKKQTIIVKAGQCFKHENRTYVAKEKSFACIGCDFLKNMPMDDDVPYPHPDIPSSFCDAPDQLNCHDLIFEEMKQPAKEKQNIFPWIIIAAISIWCIISFAIVKLFL